MKSFKDDTSAVNAIIHLRIYFTDPWSQQGFHTTHTLAPTCGVQSPGNRLGSPFNHQLYARHYTREKTFQPFAQQLAGSQKTQIPSLPCRHWLTLRASKNYSHLQLCSNSMVCHENRHGFDRLFHHGIGDFGNHQRTDRNRAKRVGTGPS